MKINPESASPAQFAGRAGAVPVFLSPGEVLDRLTILALKVEAAETDEQRDRIQAERHLLATAWSETQGCTSTASPEWSTLMAINQDLWKLEDIVRSHERSQEFGAAFVEAARAIYRANDARAAAKRRVNERLGSALCEYKFHRNTTTGDPIRSCR